MYFLHVHLCDGGVKNARDFLTARALGWGWMFFSILVLALIFAFCARCRMLATNFVKKRKEARMMYV